MASRLPGVAVSITTLEIHPLALRVPGMTEAEFVALRDDIAENGLLRAITLHDGQVLDGRHRLRACEETGTEPLFDEYDGDSPASFVLSLNAKRRSLSPSQLAMLATDFLPDLEAEANDRRLANLRRGDEVPSAPTGAFGDGGRASERAGDLVGINRRSVERAKRVNEADPDLADQVRAGEVTLRAADDQVARRLAGSAPRDGSRKRAAVELVSGLIGRLDGTPLVLREIDTASAISTPGAPLEEWNTKLTEVIQSLNRLRGDIRKEMGNA